MTLITLFYLLLFNMLIHNNKSNHSTVLPSSALSVPIDQAGKNIYIKYCLTCHQADGGGVPQMYPPLQKSDWVNGDKNKLVKIVLNGLSGEIEVNGEYFDQTMPKFDYLTNDQIADVLTYIRENYGNNSSTVTSTDVLNIRNAK